MPELVPVVPPMKSSAIEKKAEALLHYFYPNELRQLLPIPVDHFFELIIPSIIENFKTSYTDLQMLGICAEGYTNAEQRISIVDKSLADDTSKKGWRRFRATVGHEAGHCILHVPLRRWQASLSLLGRGMKRERSTMKAYEDPEWQAWRFAHAFCMPACQVKKAVSLYGVDSKGIISLVDLFDMNKSFVVTRLKMLKLLH